MKQALIVALCILTLSCKTNQTNPQPVVNKLNEQIEQFYDSGIEVDTITTQAQRQVALAFIRHGSVVVDIDGFVVYIDPVTMFGTDFVALPKADMILVTHEHKDHFDPDAIAQITTDSTKLIVSERVAELYGNGLPMLPGDTIEIEPQNFTLTATPAYNITEGHLDFHPKARKDIGFIFDIDGTRIYVAGDTEDIPEMADFRDIDIAFLPVNQPYTMTPEQALRAADMIGPRILYPYHFGDTDLRALVERLATSDIDVRIRNLR